MNEATHNKSVLISGAGIAGLTSAYRFHKIGWNVVVLEKASELRKWEFVIDFAWTGWDVAEKMWITDELKKRKTSIERMSFKDHHDTESVGFEMKKFAEMVGVGEKHVHINRREMQNILYESVIDDVEIRYSSSITSISEHDTWVDTEILDSKTNKLTKETYDLVIGADGLHSNVRTLVFGEEVQFAKYLGYYVSAFRVDSFPWQEPYTMNILREPRKQATYLDMGNGKTLVMLVCASEKNEYIHRNKRKQVIQETFVNMKGIIPDAIDAITEDTNVYMDTTTQIIMPKWHSRRVVLVGDSWYCLTLVSGQGASMAMGGAYLLAQEIEKAENIEQGLIHYDARFRSFVADLQNKSRKFAKAFIPKSTFGIWMMDMMMRLLGNPIVRYFAKWQFSVKSFFEDK